jgi:hypothetical protein
MDEHWVAVLHASAYRHLTKCAFCEGTPINIVGVTFLCAVTEYSFTRLRGFDIVAS